MKKILSTECFDEFFSSLNERDKKKVARHIDQLAALGIGDVKYVREQVYELRVNCGSLSYRVLFIYDRGNIIVLLCGFAKKTQKTESKYINQAIRLKKEYYETD